jgi:hypothetical protein
MKNNSVALGAVNPRSLVLAALLLGLFPALARSPQTPSPAAGNALAPPVSEAQAAMQNQAGAYVSYAFLAVCVLSVVIVARKAQGKQKMYMERALQVQLANQKLLEEIRDLLKNGRT